MDIRKLLAGEGRTAHTVGQYMSLLQRLHRRATGKPEMENLLWLHDVDAISKALAAYKPASCKLYLVPVMILLRRGKHDELFQKYHVMFVKAMHEIADEKKSGNLFDEAALASITKGEIERLKKVLAKNVKERLSQKGPNSLNEQEKTLLMQHLMLSLYTAIVPLSSDLANVPIVRLGQSHNEKSIDAIVEVCIKTFVLWGHKRRGEKEEKIAFSRAINNQIAESLRLFPRRFILSDATGEEGMSPKVLRQTFSAIFGETVIPNSSIVRLFGRA